MTARALTPLFALSLLCAAPAARAASLEVAFEGLRGGGVVQVAVFDSEKAWKANRPIHTVTAPVERGSAHARLELPDGVYGLMAFQDLNQNRRLDTLPIGLPKEPYGFSNDARGMFGPPAWASAQFRLDADGGRRAIRLK